MADTLSDEKLSRRHQEWRMLLNGLGPLDPDLSPLAVIARDSSDAIILLDLEGNILQWNKGAEGMYGWTQEEALTMETSQLLPADRPQELINIVETVTRGVTVASFDTKRLTKDGRLLDVWLTVSRLDDTNGRPLAITLTERDITARKKAEIALHGLVEKLLHKNRELRDVSSMTAHDLREPLILIKSFSNRLITHKELQAEKRTGYLQKINQIATRMLHLLESMLAYSRVTFNSKAFSKVDLAEVVNDVLSDLEERIRITEGKVEVGELPTITADAIQMHQLLRNLIDNALKFYQPGELPQVRIVSHAPVQEEDSKPYCKIIIEDKGIGFNEEYKQKIFLFGQRLHRKEGYEGSGIGLAICKRIVERHGGLITVESMPGKGTKFIITLPM